MFWLLGNNSGFAISKRGTSTIGRIAGDIIIKDSSVSRKHAEIEVRDGLAFLRDCKSKYFTKCNGRIVVVNEEIKLEDGAEITFGEVQFKFHVGEKLVVCSTGAKDKERSIATIVKQLGGSIMKEWDNTCTHLTISEMLITLKVLHAIMDNKKIVTPYYWDVYLKNITSGQMPPDVSEYYPPLGENIINSSYVTYNPDRNSVFQGKTFGFWNKKKQLKFEAIIRKAGGECVLLDRKLGDDGLLKLMNEYIIIDPEDPIVEQEFLKVLESFKNTGNRTIPVQEIVLAILQCSCKENCNPTFNRALTVFARETQTQCSSKPVVPETQSQQFDVQVDIKPGVIPATMEPNICTEALENVSESLELPEACTSRKTQSSLEETQLPAKRIKLDPEIVTGYSVESPAVNKDVSAKKATSSMFKRMMRETSPPPTKRSKNEMYRNPFAGTASKNNPYSSMKQVDKDLDLTDNPFGQMNLRKSVDVKSENTEDDDVLIVQATSSNLSKNQPTTSKKLPTTLVKGANMSRKKSKPFAESTNINYSSMKHDVSSGKWVDSKVKQEESPKRSSQDDEERKWCEKFNNSVVIVVKDLLRKDRLNQEISQTPSYDSAKNFKKFRKVPVPKSGIIIKCSRAVFGDSIQGVDYGCSEDEDNRDI